MIQFLVVLAAIIIGARLGGIGLGVMGGVGLLILTFVFGLQPTTPPVDVMLMIAAVISAASCMQAAGGLEYMVKLAERILRKNPSRVTILSPLVTYLFTFVAGTGHIAYSVLPVIAEVARETRIRPERPLGIAVIASQQAITASPISAATVALLGLLSGAHFSLFDILKISVPATLAGVLVGAFCSLKVAGGRTGRGLLLVESGKRTDGRPGIPAPVEGRYGREYGGRDHGDTVYVEGPLVGCPLPDCHLPDCIVRFHRIVASYFPGER